MLEEYVPSAHTPQASKAAGAKRNFRQWRRTRPFWGGLLLILSGVELFLSANMNLGNLQVHLGPTGFLSYVIPALLILCGAGVWMTPNLRMFYGILGSLVAVYSLIGLNFGGFLLGLLFGIIGGAMAIAWSPVPATGEAADTPAEDDEPGPDAPVEGEEADFESEPTTVLDRFSEPSPEPAHGHGQTYRSAAAYGDTAEIPRQVERPERRWPAPEAGAHRRGEEPPPYGTSSGGGHTRILAITLVPVTLAAALVTVVHGSTPAYAAPCPTPRPAASAAGKATPGKPGQNAASAKPGQQVAPQNGQLPVPLNSDGPSAAQPAPSGPPAGDSAQEADKSSDNPLIDAWNGFVDGVKRFFGGGNDDAPPADLAPSASPSASASPGASASSSTGGAPLGVPTPSAGTGAKQGGAQASPSSSAAPCQINTAAVVPSQPLVSAVPGVITGASQVMEDFKFEGQVELSTKSGTVKALKFTLSKATTTPFKLKVPERSGKATQIDSSKLIIQAESDKVTFYASKFTGTLASVTLPVVPVTIPPELLNLLKPLTTLTLAPDSPNLLFLPPITFPRIEFRDVTLDLAFVNSDVLTADDLHISVV
ncbi:hypothetical protein GCM10009835_28260 [Planosporangium flavigriseum]|uniref:Uncharacterized protein n=2 Tax=Planosporangium flavigriseum TaxID=373681 RepID=A0A8J3LNA1_9ACTN|nr:DUF6114 domain-containing protein [Planosporangium flavigriseum]GIG76298.1 hypothetical protein Pfl04_47020 [Planosporangium flavigriseum]